MKLSAVKVLLLVLLGLSICIISLYQTGAGSHIRSLDLNPNLVADAPARTSTEPPALGLTPMFPAVWQNPAYAARRYRAQNVCSKVRGGHVARLTRYGQVSYCVVPKVGCTFWLNVFRFLHNDTGNASITSPFGIPRHFTHYGPRKHMKYYSTNSSFSPAHLVNDLRFMFVREPYSRLWSAYVDKFLLIDYWRSDGKLIVQQRPGNKTAKDMCAGDISFREFVEYIVKYGTKRPSHLNEHWKPVQYLCSPCYFVPHVIGKIETFAKDARYVLSLMNSSWVLDTYRHADHVHQEMDMLVTYNFQLLNSPHYKACTNASDLARRLWRTFQINGYLPVEQAFPFPANAVITAPFFASVAHQAYRTRPSKTAEEWRRQREQAMADAFAVIPTDTMGRLRDLYMADFEMFGYDPEPHLLFGHRRNTTLRAKT